jgi:hypothetical protein
MLNKNKIESLINYGDSNPSIVSKHTGINYQTLKSKLKSGVWLAVEIEILAKYFKKPITYFFGEDEKNSVDEPGVTTYSCPDCIKKQKEIDRLQKEKDEIKDKYINCLEQLNNSKGGGHIANSA